LKKAILKGIVFGITFFAAIFIISRIMNQGNNDLTAEMPPASLPVVYMGMDGMVYNELHGYVQPMNTVFMRDTITGLNGGRTTEFAIETYGMPIAALSYEVRSVDGSRLIENTSITEYEERDGRITGTITVKDLIEQNKEYELILLLGGEDGRNIRYYTRIVWTENFHLAEKLQFAMDFHHKTFDKDAVRDLAIYMETNAEGDNSTLHKVDIHCTLNQISWGKLQVSPVTDPIFNVTELAAQTASIVSHYVVSTGSGDDIKYFYVEEYYRLRYTTDRIYLLDYNRTMNSLVDEQDDIYANDKILIGVESEDMPVIESEDGNVFAFEVQNRLYSYNVTTNRIAVIFGFYDRYHADARTLYNQHGIKVLDIDEGGVRFAVYGYMNRGSHEGEVGLQIYYYDSTVNTVEEELYIPYHKTYQILKSEVEQLIYLSRENYLYLKLDNFVYEINLAEKTYSQIVEITQDGSMKVSGNNKMVVWQTEGNLYEAKELVLMNLASREKISISAGANECIMPLGFMGEDLVYGLARRSDIYVDSAGRTTFPMYAVHISSPEGKTLKTYRQEDIFVSSCIMQNNQITLNRLIKTENGSYVETVQDYIMNSSEEGSSKNMVSAVITENYGKYIQIAVRKAIDEKTLQVLTPKEVLYEGSRELIPDGGAGEGWFYVYGPEGIAGIYREPAKAVLLADSVSGIVMNDSGDYVWLRGNRAARNQIMAIEAAEAGEERSSLSVCLDAMLKLEGVFVNSEYLLARGKSAYAILEENLVGAQILDLKGCSPEAVLYYVNQDIPVLAALNDGNAVLIVGFNEYSYGVMNPQTGDIKRVGQRDFTEWMQENGNSFMTYIR